MHMIRDLLYPIRKVELYILFFLFIVTVIWMLLSMCLCVCLLHIIYDVWLCRLTDLSLTQPQAVVYYCITVYVHSAWNKYRIVSYRIR